jgi:hypothetical protein
MAMCAASTSIWRSWVIESSSMVAATILRLRMPIVKPSPNRFSNEGGVEQRSHDVWCEALATVAHVIDASRRC